MHWVDLAYYKGTFKLWSAFTFEKCVQHICYRPEFVCRKLFLIDIWLQCANTDKAISSKKFCESGRLQFFAEIIDGAV